LPRCPSGASPHVLPSSFDLWPLSLILGAGAFALEGAAGCSSSEAPVACTSETDCNSASDCVDGNCVDASSSNSSGGRVSCVSNSDCPAPTAVCDAIKGTCVERLVLDDCQNQPNTVCSLGSCVCESGFGGSGGSCLDVSSDRENCGACGNICGMDQQGSSGACGPCPLTFAQPTSLKTEMGPARRSRRQRQRQARPCGGRKQLGCARGAPKFVLRVSGACSRSTVNRFATWHPFDATSA
jgi:hypothetical protein